MPAFSHSRIACFEQCPQKYKFSYIDRIDPEFKTTVEAFLGSCVHEALQKLYRDRMHEKELSLEDLLAFYNMQWEKEWEESILIVRKDYTQANYRKMGERYLADYYHRHAPFDSGRIIGLETKEFLPLDKEGTYRFHIRIDRLMDAGGGIYEVHDYKSGQSLPKQEDLEQDRQLAMYALWVKERFQDFREARLVWHCVAFDKEMGIPRTKKNLESLNLKEEILRKIRAIELAEQFSPIVSTLCSWCGFQKDCPMWKHEKVLEEKPANEYLNDPGVKLVDEYVRIKKELDEFSREASEKLEKLKDALIGFCLREGVSALAGTVNRVVVKEYESLKFPAKNTEERQALVEALTGMGKLIEVMDLDLSALKKIMQGREWDESLLRVLEKFGIVEKSYRLSVQKK